MRHPRETDIVLCAGGELPRLRRWWVGRHVASCAECQETVARYRADRDELIEAQAALPAYVNWDRLAAEMHANIRVGLAAGECVAAPAWRNRRSWQMAVGLAGATCLLLTAWFLNVPRSAFLPAGPWQKAAVQPLRVTPNGIEVNEKGSALMLMHRPTTTGEPGTETIYTSEPDALRARSFDAKTGQVTIQMVYAQ